MELRCYESVVVYVPELDEAQLEEQVGLVQKILESGDALLVEIENWGKKRLAYEIEKKREGQYVLFRFKAQGSLIEELERNYKLNGDILRYLTVRVKDRECQKAKGAEQEEKEE